MRPRRLNRHFLSNSVAKLRSFGSAATRFRYSSVRRSEEHTSELQSPDHLVCRLLLEKKKKSNLMIMTRPRLFTTQAPRLQGPHSRYDVALEQWPDAVYDMALCGHRVCMGTSVGRDRQ